MKLKFKFFFLVLGTSTFWSSNHLTRAFQITGAPARIDSQTGDLPHRVNIDDFARSGPAFDLFVLAMQQFQSVDQIDPLSYFQVAGIHGFPNAPWDGVIGRGTNIGYCMHASVLFPLWHRPYIALFEQLVWTHAQQVAATYPPDQVDRYTAAASTLRIPYWDWVNSPTLPESYTKPTIFINGPTGWHEIKNPLYRYDFHPGSESSGFPASFRLSQARYTTRCADSALNQSDNSQATLRMIQGGPTRHSLSYQLLSAVADYDQFSTILAGDVQGAPPNIENIHNGVHNAVGCDEKGTMFWAPSAAFDPIFWLHHAQVDRLLTLWQALNPNSFVVSMTNAYGSYYEPANTIDTGSTVLAPFHIDNGTTLFTAESARSAAFFGYSYPDLAGLNTLASNGDQQSILRTRINRLYNAKIATAPNEMPVRKVKRAPTLVAAFSHITLRDAQEMGVNNLEMQWSIRVQINEMANDSPATIHFFMGVPPARCTQWSTAPNLVGSYAQLRVINSALNHTVGAASLRIHGEISFTHVLAAGVVRGYLSDMTPREVVPLLRKHLVWRAVTPSNQEIPIEAVSGLSVSVFSRKIRPSRNMNEFPEYGAYHIHHDATAGKAGGVAPGWRKGR